MSNREKCYMIIDGFTEEQLANIVALLSSAKTLADETADDAYCLRLYKEYEQDPDKEGALEIAEFANQLGVAL